MTMGFFCFMLVHELLRITLLINLKLREYEIKIILEYITKPF